MNCGQTVEGLSAMLRVTSHFQVACHHSSAMENHSCCRVQDEFWKGMPEVRESGCQSLKLFRRAILKVLPKTMRMERTGQMWKIAPTYMQPSEDKRLKGRRRQMWLRGCQYVKPKWDLIDMCLSVLWHQEQGTKEGLVIWNKGEKSGVSAAKGSDY